MVLKQCVRTCDSCHPPTDATPPAEMLELVGPNVWGEELAEVARASLGEEPGRLDQDLRALRSGPPRKFVEICTPGSG